MSIWDWFGQRPRPVHADAARSVSPPAFDPPATRAEPPPAEPHTPANEVARQARLLSARSELLRKTAAEELGQLGAAAQEAVPELLVAVTDSEPAVRQAARDALRRVAPEWAKLPSVVRAVPPLIDRLASPFTDVWQAAAGLLRQIGPPAVDELTAALGDDSRSGSHTHLLHLLGNVGPPAAGSAAVVAGRLRSDEAHVRIAAAEALAGLRACPAEFVHDLVKLSGDRNPQARCAAARALTLGGVPEDVAARALLPLLLDATREVHDSAADGFKRLGPVAAGLLAEFLATTSFDFADRWIEECLKLIDRPTFFAQWRSSSGTMVVAGRDEKQIEELERNADLAVRNRRWAYAEADERAATWERAREAALRVLAVIGPPPDSLDVLTAALDSGHKNVRGAAVLALGRLGPLARPAVPAIARTYAAAGDAVRKSIREALPAIDPAWQQHPDLAAAAEQLIGTAGGVGEAADAAAEALRFIGPAAVPALLAVLPGRDRIRQERAATLLGEIGGGSPDVILALRAVADDPTAHGWVRDAAKRAVERLTESG